MSEPNLIKLEDVVSHVLFTSYPFRGVQFVSCTVYSSPSVDYYGAVTIVFDEDGEAIDRFARALFETTRYVYGKPVVLFAARGMTHISLDTKSNSIRSHSKQMHKLLGRDKVEVIVREILRRGIQHELVVPHPHGKPLEEWSEWDMTRVASWLSHLFSIYGIHTANLPAEDEQEREAT